MIGPIDIAEEKPVTFPFAGEVPAGETISSVQTEVTVVQGTDNNPSGILVGQPVPFQNLDVLLRVRAAVAGVRYHIRVIVTDSAGFKHTVSTDLDTVRR